MSNPSKRRGTAFESAVVSFLAQWWPHVERRTLAGINDRGDIAGIPGVCIEAKSCKAFTPAEWIAEAVREGQNAKARVAVVWAKRRGKASAGDGYVLMTGHQFVALLHDAGYADTWPGEP